MYPDSILFVPSGLFHEISLLFSLTCVVLGELIDTKIRQNSINQNESCHQLLLQLFLTIVHSYMFLSYGFLLCFHSLFLWYRRFCRPPHRHLYETIDYEFLARRE